ncbi:creatininase family protein [Taibaiella soli]|uniref:Creatininase family protein n=1 Tax=Taibaiella soli TaxID=1649169 RepID=A0A2W2BBW8_9BACT|nr:creatininase family protein [Taibaiella soli]PZF73709.1 creatininase family protein [Taibaiella soli]
MHFSSANWQQIEAYLQNDDRCILPVGSTEQHAYLSLSTDSILAERISLDAALPLGIPVLPTVNYGVTPLFMAYPGTITIRPQVMIELVNDILDSLARHGFKRVLIVNGHGGNIDFLNEVLLQSKSKNIQVKLHHWWKAPLTMQKVLETDPVASHASWMENFPWTRIGNVQQPAHQKEAVDIVKLKTLSPEDARMLLGDGNYAGFYQKPDAEMLEIWHVAVNETRALLENW